LMTVIADSDWSPDTIQTFSTYIYQIHSDACRGFYGGARFSAHFFNNFFSAVETVFEE